MGVVVWFQFPTEIETPGWKSLGETLIVGFFALEELGFFVQRPAFVKASH